MPLFIISGVPGTGKSCLCRALLQHYPFGLHLPVDDLREFVVSGIAHPVPTVGAETLRQFALARRGAGQLAALYGAAGFAVALDDVLGPADAAAFHLPEEPHKILLRADLNVVLERNRVRQNKAFDPGHLEPVIRSLHAQQRVDEYERHGWHVLHTTHLSVNDTARRILDWMASGGGPS